MAPKVLHLGCNATDEIWRSYLYYIGRFNSSVLIDWMSTRTEQLPALMQHDVACSTFKCGTPYIQSTRMLYSSKFKELFLSTLDLTHFQLSIPYYSLATLVAVGFRSEISGGMHVSQSSIGQKDSQLLDHPSAFSNSFHHSFPSLEITGDVV